MRSVRTYASLDTEVPMIPLLGPTHLGTTFSFATLRLGRLGDQGRVDHRSLVRDQAALTHQGVDLIEHGLGQAVTFDLMQQFQIGGLVWHAPDQSIQTSDAAQQRNFLPTPAAARSE